jgi:spore maturation protein CgeB
VIDAAGLRVAIFAHSLLSDWNHGNAHFLRGIVRELVARGAVVTLFEPEDGWSRRNLIADHGGDALAAVERVMPELDGVAQTYRSDAFDVARALDDVDLVLVHEWTEPELVAAIGRHRARHGGYRLLFHDTHHRAVTDPEAMARYDLGAFDGVLAFGSVLRELYLERGWCERAWTWHEAADVRHFRPLTRPSERDLVWIGNWGDDERGEELREFLVAPVSRLGLRARVHGVRYPAAALEALDDAGIDYGGWLPNHRVPELFARSRVTVHVPRRPYTEALPGIPTIRPFEALACGIPLVSSPWDDAEGLFESGRDYLVAGSGAEMTAHLREVLAEGELARSLSEHGLATILARHTCGHRVDELLGIVGSLAAPPAAATARRMTVT